MTEIELLGFSAALMTSSAYLPQLHRLWLTGLAAGISPLTYAMLTFGKIFWLTYGALSGSLPIICSNSFTLTLAGIILTFTLRPDWLNRARASRKIMA